ncbi:hypothetical protein MPSEU_000346600 [Mayamaea pseudoterrestris]|nr:hypothetical protein MPSEU_000346600 [Mayamaea pseudoterrestris]
MICAIFIWKIVSWRNQRALSIKSVRRKHFASLDSTLMDDPLFSQRKRRQRSRSRSGSYSSFDLSTSNSNHEGEYDDLFELLAVERSANQENPMSRIHYYGPKHFSLIYETLVPPPSWLEVSRQVIPPDKHFRLERYLALTMSESPTLGIHHATNGHLPEAAQVIAQRPLRSMPHAIFLKKSQEKDPPVEIPLEHAFLQIVNPVESGIIQLHVKQDATSPAAPPLLAQRNMENDREWTMEHTLGSAAIAAQFQTDVLALQTLGSSIYNMFQALQVIHQGSIAYAGKEFVWHDDHAIGNDPNACDDDLLKQCCYGIAWDDCVRCFGSAFPSLRLRLEALWWKHATEHVSKDSGRVNDSAADTATPNSNGDKDGTSGFRSEYVEKRLLIGPVDFFRLFVPHLPSAAVPRDQTSKARVEQLFRWRKRVARASILVNAYCDARRVVNKGWNLDQPVPDNYWKRRMAFDDNNDNSRWDSSSDNKQVYYEGTVSRDVVCQVRGTGFKQNRSNTALSLTQGYSLVGIHTFKVAMSDKNPVLRHDTDPVLAIPSLRTLVDTNPELDFFVSCVHVHAHRLWHVAVFVRSLPEGVDPSFDTAVQNFKMGGPRERDSKLDVVIHLGTPRDRLQWKTYLGVNFLSLLSLMTNESSPIQTHSAGDRTPLPALRISSCGDVSHFGGSLQRDGLPGNYVSHVATLSSKKTLTFAMRTLLLFIEKPGFEHDVLDVSYVLASATDEESPERVLSSYRMVQMKTSTALPGHFVTPTQLDNHNLYSPSDQDNTDEPSDTTKFLKLFITDPFLATIDPMMRFIKSPTKERMPTQANYSSPLQFIKDIAFSFIESNDPLEQAVNEMVNGRNACAGPIPLAAAAVTFADKATAAPDGFLSVPIVRMVTRDDIRRSSLSSRCSHTKSGGAYR